MNMESNEAYVLRTDDGCIATLTLNRPQQFNALSSAMIAALQTEIDRLAKDKDIRVVVLAGEGRAFCAGHDLKEMRANYSKDFQAGLFARCATLMTSLVALPQPVIARVHGIATAAGCQLVSMCDLALAADSARFAVSGINVGLFCASPGVGLSRNVARKQAFEMLVTGDFISAHEAVARGLINRAVAVDALDDEISRLARQIAAKPPAAIAAGKRLFYRQLEMGVEAAYQLAGETMACNMMEADTAEGVDAFIEKRPPRWTAA